MSAAVADAGKTLLDARVERTFVAALIAYPSVFYELPSDMGLDVFGDFQAQLAFKSVANMLAAGDSVSRESVRADIAREAGHLDVRWFDAIAAIDVPPGAPVIGWANTIIRMARQRADAINEANETERIQDEITDFGLRDAEPAPAPVHPWRRAPELVDAIMERAADPWVSLTVGGEALCSVRAGGTAVLIGGSGSGKSSLACTILMEHALNVGPAIALSIELPAEELAARIVGQKCDASWEEALRGHVARNFMEQALNAPRLYVLDRRRATIANLEKCVDAARAEYPNQPILAAIDYAQLLDSKEREVRQRVADAFAQIDDVAREKRFVAVALSQMSRASTQKARKGEAIGADAAELGAETAAIERFATVTLSIGLAAPREDGSDAVELSIGKWRMGKGDVVIPMSSWGRSGRWRKAGDSKTATEVRETREVEKVEKRTRSTEMQLIGAVSTATAPMSRNQLVESLGGRKQEVLKGVSTLIANGTLVEIAKHAPRSRSWLIWTPDRARDAGAPLVRDTLFEGHR